MNRALSVNFTLAFRELAFTFTRLRLVYFVLLIGFSGPLIALTIAGSTADFLRENSKLLLSADLTVNSLRSFSSQEIKTVHETLKPVRMSAETEFVTMATAGVTTRDAAPAAAPATAASPRATLVEVEGVDEEFPIYGRFRFSSGEPPSTSACDLIHAPLLSAWVSGEVLSELGVKRGDYLKLGDREFKIDRVIDDAPGASRAGGFAPRVFIPLDAIDQTGLTRFGSQIFQRLYLQLPLSSKGPEINSDEASDRLKASLGDPDIFTRTPDDSVQGFERFFRYLNGYLVVVTMVIFVLSWIAAFYCLQIYLKQRIKNAALYIVFGASRFRVAGIYVLQVLVLVLMALVSAGVLICGVVAILAAHFQSQFPEGFSLRIGFDSWLKIFLIGIVSALAFSMPLVLQIYFLNPQSLLGEDEVTETADSQRLKWLSFTPLVVVFALLSVWLMNSVADAARVAGGMFVAGVIGLLVGRLLFGTLFQVFKHRPGFVRLVVTQLSRGRMGVQLGFLVLVLSALVLNLVPHLLASLMAELRPIEARDVPALFLFNIPESKIDQVKKFAENQPFELRYLSPLVLGRLRKVNGQATSNDQFQRFPMRLSYRSERIPSESLVAGREFSGVYDSQLGKPAEISVEEKFAERAGFHLGDEIEFDVQGLPVSARIVNFRQVHWTAFNPNFFIMFQPGVLDDAPKLWVGNVYSRSGGLSPEIKGKLQFDLTRDFPDISIIDIGRTLDRVLEIAAGVVTPVRASSLIAVLMTGLILLAIVSHNLNLRVREIEIEKLFGAGSGLLRFLLLSEYTILAGLAWLVGSLSAVALTWLATRHLLDIEFVISWPAIIVSFIATIGFTAAIALNSSERILRRARSSP